MPGTTETWVEAFWSSMTEGLDPETSKLVKFALPKLAEQTVVSVGRERKPADEYATILFMAADAMYNQQPEHSNGVMAEIAVVAMMVALEESCYQESLMSYGAELLRDIKKAGIYLPRSVVAAFLAQEGTFASNRSKGDLMNGSIAAVAVYAARLQTLCLNLDGLPTTFTADNPLNAVMPPEKDTKEVFAYYLNEYAVPYLTLCGSEKAAAEVKAFLSYLDKTDFYQAPCSTKYHLSCDGGLAQHTLHVLMELVRLILPATREQIGSCVMAAICHDLCKIGVYQRRVRAKKVYSQQTPEGVSLKKDSNGTFYWAEETFYEYSDSMPFGHGRKSAYMAMGFFPEMGDEVYAAIEAHMGIESDKTMGMYASNKIALYLHIADMAATNLIERK